jgi:hypothetical protein
METRDTNRPFTKEQERHLLRLAKKLFMEQHPNPQRIGCPGAQLLKAVADASPVLPPAQQNAIMEHLSICSPCYREFYGYRRSVRFRRQIPIFLGVAVITIVAGVLAYDYFARPAPSPQPQQPIAREEPAAPVYEQALLDLRGHSPARSQTPAPTPAQSELALPRGRLTLTIVLPVGSEEGNYSIRLGRPGEEAVLAARGRAEINDGTTSFEVRIHTSNLSPGQYVLGVRQEPWAWAEYKVELR